MILAISNRLKNILITIATVIGAALTGVAIFFAVKTLKPNTPSPDPSNAPPTTSTSETTKETEPSLSLSQTQNEDAISDYNEVNLEPIQEPKPTDTASLPIPFLPDSEKFPYTKAAIEEETNAILSGDIPYFFKDTLPANLDETPLTDKVPEPAPPKEGLFKKGVKTLGNAGKITIKTTGKIISGAGKLLSKLSAAKYETDQTSSIETNTAQPSNPLIPTFKV